MSTFEIKSRFTGSVLFAAELSAEFDGTSFSVRLGATVKLAVKAGAYLAGANLADADLADADLAGANLAGADLAGADLAGADLAGAKRGEYIVDGDISIIPCGAPNGWHALGYVDSASRTIRVEVGCRRFSLAEGRAHWAGRDDRREVLAALDYIEAVARIRGWSEPAAASDAA